jgi:hypothetical protein
VSQRGFFTDDEIPRPTGRPSLYTPELADEICRRLAEGESLRTICRDSHVPNLSTVLEWVRDDRGDFGAMYRRARETQAHVLAEQVVEAAFTAPDPQQGRLRFDALRWYASKLLPKVYGERVEVDQTTRAVISDEPMTEEEWLRKFGANGADSGPPAPEYAH